MTPTRSLAVAQTTPTPGDVPANLAQQLHLAHLAADAGAHLLLFPGFSLTGYELHLAPTLAFTEHDPRLAPLRDLATTRNLTLVVGAPLRVDPHLHIASFILAPDGTIAHYTKHHLGAFLPTANPDGPVPPPEPTVFHPGERDPLLPLAPHPDAPTAALAICADTGHPSHPARAATRGATTYLASMFVIPSDHPAEAATLRSYATRHAMTVAMANYGAPTGGLPAAGRSAIWSESGEFLVQLEPEGAGVAIAIETPAGWSARIIGSDRVR